MAHPVNEREWLAVIGDFRRSGLTQVDFCHRRGISVWALRYRLYHRLAPATDSSAASSAPRASHHVIVLRLGQHFGLFRARPRGTLSLDPPSPLTPLPGGARGTGYARRGVDCYKSSPRGGEGDRARGFGVGACVYGSRSLCMSAWV
jgi:hypothetical protein